MQPVHVGRAAMETEAATALVVGSDAVVEKCDACTLSWRDIRYVVRVRRLHPMRPMLSHCWCL